MRIGKGGEKEKNRFLQKLKGSKMTKQVKVLAKTDVSLTSGALAEEDLTSRSCPLMTTCGCINTSVNLTYAS